MFLTHRASKDHYCVEGEFLKFIMLCLTYVSTGGRLKIKKDRCLSNDDSLIIYNSA